MGVSFRPAGYGNCVEERRDESHDLKISGSPSRAAKAQEKPDGLKQTASMVGSSTAAVAGQPPRQSKNC
jgi:hypothetical protein